MVSVKNAANMSVGSAALRTLGKKLRRHFVLGVRRSLKTMMLNTSMHGGKMKTILIILMISLFIGCTNQKEARRVLEMEGLTDIQFTGYSWFTCSKDDFYHTGFSGIRNSKRVEGTVCSGLWLRGSTVRY